MIDPPTTMGIIGSSLIIFGLLWHRKPKISVPPESRVRKSVLCLIQEANSIDELMNIVKKYYFDDDEDSEAFFRKVIRYRGQLDHKDWKAIYLRAAQGSRLQEVANKQMRDAA